MADLILTSAPEIEYRYYAPPFHILTEKIACAIKFQRKVTVSLDGYPYLGIWSPPGAPFVCIEPWLGVASPEDSDGDITKKPGIISLESGKKFHCDYKIMID